MTIAAAEQLLIELVNRARLDPLGEAARYGIDLNAGLQPGTLDGSSKQVLAANDLLNDSAQAHSEWMLANNTFSHTGDGGSSPHQRMAAAGYSFAPPWSSGENIAWTGSTRMVAEIDALTQMHKNLFLSSGHRTNLLNDGFRDLGVASVLGAFKPQQTTYSYSYMLTENFAVSDAALFITGVVHSDSDGDDFYTPGEGVAGTVVSTLTLAAVSAEAGGYALAVPVGAVSADGMAEVTVSTGRATLRMTLDMADQNAKLDIVNGTAIRLSASAILHDGVQEATLLGWDNLSLTGGSGNETLTGNGGNNFLSGGDGNDMLHGGTGDDMLRGGDGADTIHGGLGNDNIGGGAGNDLIYGSAGSNTIWAGYGNDTVHGGDGGDTIYGGAGRNQLFGNGGDDLIFTSAGGDFVDGGGGNNTIRGNDGADTIHGGLGDGNIGGGAGNDLIYGAAGANTIWGGYGDDTIHGNTCRDVMSGGPGADVFVFASAAHIGIRTGRDVITDFTAGVDKIDLHALATSFNGTAGLIGNDAASFYYHAAGGILIGDQNGDGVADWVLELAGRPAVTGADFLL